MGIPGGRDKRPETRALPLVRVAVLTDDRLFGEGLARILAAERSFAVVRFEEGAALREGDPHVLLIDSRMKEALGFCAALSRNGKPAVIFVAAPEEDEWLTEALAAGARGTLSKDARVEAMIKAVRVVFEGEIFAPRRVITARIDQLTRISLTIGSGSSLLEKRLSVREREVFRQAATGLGNKDLADRLGITEATVKVHLTRIFQKLGLNGRAELAAAYHGIIPSSSDRLHR